MSTEKESDTENQLTEAEHELVTKFMADSVRERQQAPRRVQSMTYREFIVAALRWRLVRMFDPTPALGNVVVSVLLLAAILTYRINAGLFPNIGQWQPYLLGAFGLVAVWQLIKGSFRSFFVPALTGVFAAVGLIVTQGETLFLSFPTPLYQWVALGTLSGILYAALSGRD